MVVYNLSKVIEMNVPKTLATIYIDVDVKARHKAAGTNISQSCNQFLKSYFPEEQLEEGKNLIEEIQNLRARLAQANIQLEAHTQKVKVDDSKKREVELDLAIGKLTKLNLEKAGGSFIAREEYKALFDDTMEEFGLTRKELVDKVF